MHSFNENDREKQKRSWIYLGSCFHFQVQNLKYFETLGSFITFYKPVPLPFFSAKSLIENSRLNLQQVMQPASGVKCPLTAAATSALVTVGTSVVQHVTAVLSMFRKPASWTSRPVHSVDDFRVSNWFSDTEQKPSASP